jgi:AcrR family transcriptional regulator
MIVMSRRYQLRQRAERQEETRGRIVEAAVTLHGTVGIAQTTVTQIADLAGVGRQTVYRHFPDELTLVRACSGLYWERHPFPDPEPWRAIADPLERFRTGLRESYAYHRLTEPMVGQALAVMADHPVMEQYQSYWRRAAEVIGSAWKLRGRGRELLRAAIRHAIGFPTWRSLVRDQKLSDAEAITLMSRLVDRD